MNAFLANILQRTRAILFFFAFLIIGGIITFYTIPKESYPDITVPEVYVSVSYPGMSPADAEDLLLKPLENQLNALDGLKDIKSVASPGNVTMIIEFQTGNNIDKVLQDVRAKVDVAKSNFPPNTIDPLVKEWNFSQIPILTISLAGDIPTRTLFQISNDLKQTLLNSVSQILDVNLVGYRKEMMELILPVDNISNYGLLDAFLALNLSNNNPLIGAGILTAGGGQFLIDAPGNYARIQDFMNTMLKLDGEAILRLGDIGEVHRTFEPETTLSRQEGQPAVGLEISKRLGANTLETVLAVKKVVSNAQKTWPTGVSVFYSGDDSRNVMRRLKDLQNELTSAVLLVMIVIVVTLGFRSALFVGLAVPGSFLAGILVLGLMGCSLNMVVLFALILSVGMLVDGAIVVVEYAERRMTEGFDRTQAYIEAAQHMAWPVITSTLTIIVAFLPLLFWPGIVGGFMKFLPLTLIATLSASLLMALIFTPTFGHLFGKAPTTFHAEGEAIGWLPQLYVRTLDWALHHPFKIMGGAIGILFMVTALYISSKPQIEFFPNTEPDNATILIHSLGNYSLEEQGNMTVPVEKILLANPYITSIFSSIGVQDGNVAPDVIASLSIDFTEWNTRPKADTILTEFREKSKNLPGIKIETQVAKNGPSQGKPIEIMLRGNDEVELFERGKKIRALLEKEPGLMGIEDDMSSGRAQIHFDIDRDQAGRLGASITQIGIALSMMGTGYKIGTFQPPDAREQMDIRLRLPLEERSLETLRRLTLKTNAGHVPLSTMLQSRFDPAIETISHRDGMRSVTVKADVKPGFLPNTQLKIISQKLTAQGLDKGPILVDFKGEHEDQEESSIFLQKAFGVTIFMIILILVIQFNSFFSTLLVLSAVVMSTTGVMIGLMVTGEPFGIVMGGIGVIALSGIVVSNNIIFIDTFDTLIAGFKNPSLDQVRQTILKTGAQRLRPVILTKLTCILGLLPIMLGITIGWDDRTIEIGSPSSQLWFLLSMCIVFGLAFASPLTLLFTPCALYSRALFREWWKHRRKVRHDASVSF